MATRASRLPRAMRRGGARQPVDRIGDPFRHPIAQRRAEQAEEHRQRQHLTIEIVDLPFDLRLAQRHRHRDDAFTAAGPDGGGGEQILPPSCFADEGRQPVEHDPAIHVGGRAPRQETRGEQVALARRLQLRALEEVHVLIDGAPDQHHDLIVERRQRARAARLLQRRVVLDQPLRDQRGLRRRFFDAGAELRREVGPRSRSPE